MTQVGDVLWDRPIIADPVIDRVTFWKAGYRSTVEFGFEFFGKTKPRITGLSTKDYKEIVSLIKAARRIAAPVVGRRYQNLRWRQAHVSQATRTITVPQVQIGRSADLVWFPEMAELEGLLELPSLIRARIIPGLDGRERIRELINQVASPRPEPAGPSVRDLPKPPPTIQQKAQALLDQLSEKGLGMEEAQAVLVLTIGAASDPFKVGGDLLAEVTQKITEAIREAEEGRG